MELNICGFVGVLMLIGIVKIMIKSGGSR